MFRHSFILFFLILQLLSVSISAQQQFRPPAYPLINCTPYFSFWSFKDHPGTDWTRHWTGTTMGMASLVTIDQKTYRLLGLAHSDEVPPMPLERTLITPTRTEYQFIAGNCKLSLAFLNPMLPWDMVQLSKSMGFIQWKAESLDGLPHEVSIYFDCSGEPVVNHPSQPIHWSRVKTQSLDVLSMGSLEQPVLQKAGDNLRIDWGYLYLASPASQSAEHCLGSAGEARSSFLEKGVLPADDDMRMPRAAQDDWPVMAWTFDLGQVGTSTERHLIIAYDEGYSAEFLQRKLLPYWKSKGETIADLLQRADQEYGKISAICSDFDTELMADLEIAGGEDYRDIAVLAFRQALAAHSLSADADGTPFHFSKENFSNGCIATVDVIYPASPILLLFNTELLKANLTPIFRYIETGKWKFPFAPHDLGTYPLANGQVYGGGEKNEANQMPVEETGNMLLLMYAIAVSDGNAQFSAPFFPVLTGWAEYLLNKGFDPDNQLCTDDFAGHLAHNTNLSIKAILALEAFSKLCTMHGKHREGTVYHEAAIRFAKEWEKQALDGDHYKLAFDKPGSWSQKYNLVWAEILDLHLFSKSITEKELLFYLNNQNTYGLPLDQRATYTKADWIVWTATMTKKPAEFKSLIAPLHRFLNETPDRVPFTDWYDTRTARQVGFQARSVVGGVFMKMLANKEVWEKWKRYGDGEKMKDER